MSAADLLTLWLDFSLLSLLSIGGGMIAMAPEMHRLLVDDHGWVDHTRFVDSIAIAQAAPGPNVLFVTLLGWQAGGTAGAVAATVGALAPSCTVAFAAQRWLASRRDALGASAFRAAMAPIGVGFLLATGWVLARETGTDPRLAAVTAVTVLVVLRTRLNPVWLLLAAAALGAAGWL